MSLVVDDVDIREDVAGVESFAPWSSVVSFFATDRLIGINPSSGQAARVSVRNLDANSSDTAALVAQLESRGIPRTMVSRGSSHAA